MKYYVIESGEDGISIQTHSHESLSNYISSWSQERIRQPVFLDKVPHIDKGCWYEENGVPIIKGDIIVPKPKVVVSSWEVK
jgi:hypothetical protein